ncbi:hypothetical protein H0H87_006399 [Tephrocybe sp. NHM501043]|nr:hypothetical protein H0H87_006399 [Tephrocybe sp. NHM501043]
MSPIDLTSIDGVRAYLAGTTFASHTITALSGGTANFTYRIHIMKPIDDQETFVLKHAEPFIKGSTFPFSVDRQIFESEAMMRVKAWLTADSLVTVPTIYKFDKEQHVIIMEDCGNNILTLKDFMLKSREDASVGLAAKIGESLGHFISGMHEWSRANPDGLLDLFAQNQQALSISAWATHGRVVQTLKPGEGDDVPPALANSLLDISEADIDIVKRVAEDVSTAMVAARDCVSVSRLSLSLSAEVLQFVMGDFWPGNIIVTLDDDQQLRRVYLFDWEIARPGLPGVEIGQFCAEVHLVRRYIPAAEKFTSTLLDTFLRAYAEKARPDIQIARNALTQWGTHLVVWTPRVSTWANDKVMARSVVEEGVRLIVAADEACEESLTSSFVGPLVKS